MPKVTIDGRELDVAPKTTVLRAAKQAGIDVPVFCYHPGLSIPANCRMCLVEIEKSPKPLPACYTEVGEGMVVHTQTEKVKATQKAVLEFILLNHPVDCPICDQAGECVLQEHFVTYSAQPSRISHVKVGKPKAKILGPTVVLDAERCIVCTRCVRFTEEVTKTFELTVEDRGEHSEITTPEGVELNNPYSLNVVDICPVGALTSREFRFRRRVWFMDMRDSVCTGCARGCAIRVDSAKNKVERLVPRYNPDVNNYWMCDAGRDSLNSRRDTGLTVGRVPGPGDSDREAPAQDGLQVTAKWLVEARQQGSRIGVALSASLTNEDVFAWARLATELGASVYLLPRAGWEGDTLLRTNDRDANTTGARAILEAIYGDFADAAALQRDASGLGLLLLVDNDAAAPEALVDALTNIERFVAFTDLPDGLSEVADVVVPLTQLHQREGTVTNTAGWVQRLGAPLKPAVTTVAPHVAAAVLAGAALDVSLDFTDKTKPVDLFERLAGVVPAFKHLTYKALASHGRGLTHGGELAPAREHLAGTAQWEPDPVGPTYKRPFQLRRGA
jgi:NADH-quinone oxidoreductase subunit G